MIKIMRRDVIKLIAAWKNINCSALSMHLSCMSKEKKGKKKYFWPKSFPIISLFLSLSDTLSYVQDWRHRGSMTGYSLCSTPPPNTDFLQMDQIIGAIIIPNHKEMAHTIQEKSFFFLYLFHMYTRKYVLSQIDTVFMRSAVTLLLVSERKWNQTENQSVQASFTMTPVNQSLTENRHCKHGTPQCCHSNMSQSLGHMLIKWFIKPQTFSDSGMCGIFVQNVILLN